MQEFFAGKFIGGGREGKSRKILRQNNILTFVSKMIMINDIDSQSGAAKVMTIEDIKKGEGSKKSCYWKILSDK